MTEEAELARLQKIEVAIRNWKKACYRGITPDTQAAWGAVLESLGEKPVRIEDCFNGRKTAKRVNEWLPIETAPKDCWILAHATKGTLPYHVVRWTTVAEFGYGKAGWWGDWGGHEFFGITHWMPLPVFNSQAE